MEDKKKKKKKTQAQIDTERAKSKQKSGNKSSTMDRREAEAGLNLAGNDTMSGRRGNNNPTFSEREAAAGLTLANNNTMSGKEVSDKGSRANLDKERDSKNQASLSRQRDTRERRNILKEEKMEMQRQLSFASGTREVGEIKRRFREQGYQYLDSSNVGTQVASNQNSALSTINDDGIDRINREDNIDYSGY